MSITVVGGPNNAKIFATHRKSRGRVQQGIRLGFYYLGRELRDGVRSQIKSGPKTGRLYRVKDRSRRIRASAPGEAPANRTGKLRRSVGFLVRGHQELEFGYLDDVDYGIFVEVGTKNMKPRPALRKQVDKSEKSADQHFHREIKKALNKL